MTAKYQNVGTTGHIDWGRLNDSDKQMTTNAVIKQVAIVINGVVCTMPRPNRHHNIIHALAEAGMKTPVTGEQGFIDIEGRFVDRESARRMAIESGQVTKTIHARELFSEDLW